MVVQEEALPSALWLAQRMDKLEAKCCSMQDTAQDVLLVDLRTRRGVELATLDADAVVREATAWSHTEPRPLVSHLAKDLLSKTSSLLESLCLLIALGLR